MSWNNIKTVVLFTLLLFSFDLQAIGEEGVSLESLINETLENNAQIKAASARWKASTKRPSQAGSLPNPKIGGRFKNVGFNEITLGDDPRTDIQVFVSQEIPFPGKLALKEKSAERMSKADYWVYGAVTNRLVADLKEAYYGWWFVGKSIAITELNKAFLDNFVHIAEAKYEVGDGIQQDVIRAQVEVSRLIEKLEILGKRKEIVEARIKNILNRSQTSALGKPQQVRISPFGMSLEDIMSAVSNNAPMLKSASYMVESRGESLKLAKRQYFPDFELQGTYFNRNGGDGNLKDLWQVGLGIRAPLYFWRKERFGVAEARALLVESQQNHEAAKQRLMFEAADGYETIRTASRLIDLYKKGIIPQSKLSLDSAIAGYQVGKVDLLNVLDNFVTLFDFEIEYYRQISERESAVARLEELMGTDFIGQSDGEGKQDGEKQDGEKQDGGKQDVE